MRSTWLSRVGLALAFLGSASCGGGGGDDDSKTSFQGFVQNLAQTPVDDADPVSLDALDFTFTEDPHAFDALFD